jgi:uncharacterized protein YcbK (DUF882 family)
MSMDRPRSFSPRRVRRSQRRRIGLSTIGLFGLAGIATLQLARPLAIAGRAPFAAFTGVAEPLSVAASRNAFGASQGVKLRLALPNDSLEFPLEVGGDPTSLSYRWVDVNAEYVTADSAAPRQLLAGATVVAPSIPGVYRLALSKGADEQLVAEPTLAVMVPFATKVGGFVNGYKIGTYLAERFRGGSPVQERPDGFIEVTPQIMDMHVSRHLRLGDFVTHDAQDDVWPKYVALDARLLDKLELVLAKLASWRGEDSLPNMALDVHSGYRTPAYNARVPRSARDSRHQYGDAVDLVIDADRDGRITSRDEKLVTVAVDLVEAEHPQLVGGLGVYTSRRYRTPYVHIDARGKRSRWRG